MKGVKKLIVGIIGSTILLFGIVLIVIPGPAIIVIPIGLGILATEFSWARNLLNKFRRKDRTKRNSDKMIEH